MALAQPKQNYHPLVEPLQSDTSRFMPVIWMYVQLMLTTGRVELCTHTGAVQPIDEIFYIRQWVSVFGGD
jgi:hypothetical protein